MNCSEVQNLTGQVVDAGIDERRRAEFFAHLDTCPACKRSYELELVAKTLVRSAVPRVSTPVDLRRSILATLNHEAERHSRPWAARMIAAIPVPAYGILAVAAIVMYLFLPSQQSTVDDLIRHNAENDVMHQATANFALIQDGTLKPSVISCSPETTYGYLHSQHLPFQALVRPIDRCEGYGAVVSDYHGAKLAHVVYSIGNDLLYICQVGRNEAMTEDGRLTMPPAAKQALLSSGWYADPQHADCNLLVWEEGGTICTATSTMSKTKMLALLTER